MAPVSHACTGGGGEGYGGVRGGKDRRKIRRRFHVGAFYACEISFFLFMELLLLLLLLMLLLLLLLLLLLFGL